MSFIVMLMVSAYALISTSSAAGYKATDNPLPCLSETHRSGAKTCMNQLTALLNQTTSTSTNVTMCLPKCVLQQWNAIDSAGVISSTSLAAVITAANLTSTRKINATTTLTTCLASNASVNANDTCLCSPPSNGRPQQSNGKPSSSGFLGFPRPGQAGGNAKPTLSADCLPSAQALRCLKIALHANSCGQRCQNPTQKPKTG